MLGRDRADAVAVGVVDRKRIDKAQPERALRDEPRFVTLEPILRQLGGCLCSHGDRDASRR